MLIYYHGLRRRQPLRPQPLSQNPERGPDQDPPRHLPPRSRPTAPALFPALPPKEKNTEEPPAPRGRRDEFRRPYQPPRSARRRGVRGGRRRRMAEGARVRLRLASQVQRATRQPASCSPGRGGGRGGRRCRCRGWRRLSASTTKRWDAPEEVDLEQRRPRPRAETLTAGCGQAGAGAQAEEHRARARSRVRLLVGVDFVEDEPQAGDAAAPRWRRIRAAHGDAVELAQAFGLRRPPRATRSIGAIAARSSSVRATVVQGMPRFARSVAGCQRAVPVGDDPRRRAPAPVRRRDVDRFAPSATSAAAAAPPPTDARAPHRAHRRAPPP